MIVKGLWKWLSDFWIAYVNAFEDGPEQLPIWMRNHPVETLLYVILLLLVLYF